MKRLLPSIILIMFIVGLFLPQLVLPATANPSIPPEIPPIVTVSNVSLNATVFVQDNQLWARVDVEYITSTIHGYGESYYLPYDYDSSIRIKHTVVTDLLEADYPMSLNATNIIVKVDGEEKDWYLKGRSIYHLYGTDMPRIGWVMQPTPRNFVVNVHYEHPLLKTSDNECALILPLDQRYGSTGAPYYPLYHWFGQNNLKATIHLQTENGNFTAYSVFNDGSMSQLNIENSAVTLTRTGQVQFPLGVLVLTEALQPQEDFPFIIILLAIILIAIGAVLSVRYLKKSKAKGKQVPIK